MNLSSARDQVNVPSGYISETKTELELALRFQHKGFILSCSRGLTANLKLLLNVAILAHGISSEVL